MQLIYADDLDYHNYMGEPQVIPLAKDRVLKCVVIQITNRKRLRFDFDAEDFQTVFY